MKTNMTQAAGRTGLLRGALMAGLLFSAVLLGGGCATSTHFVVRDTHHYRHGGHHYRHERWHHGYGHHYSGHYYRRGHHRW